MNHSLMLWMISGKEVTKLTFATKTVYLYCGDLDLRLNPEEFNVDEAYRFEGDSDPDDNVAFYAITSSTGVKGIIVDGDRCTMYDVGWGCRSDA